jgi:cellulose biosynthesis protein BcsQ
VIGWGEVIERLLQAVEMSSERSRIARVCVVRDLRGRVRLAIEPAEHIVPDAQRLEDDLTANLGGWFAGPTLWTTQPSALEERRLAKNLLEVHQATWPAAWPRSYRDPTGGEHVVTTGSGGVWCGELRTRSKDTWLHKGHITPPWPLHDKTPAIVSFYSFKGGVGRTTTLGIVARQLVKQGHRVVAIDLDLEAPGLGPLFDVRTDRGVLDLLAEHAATGRIDLQDPDVYSATAQVGTGELRVYPVGALDETYIERLACLDYAPSGPFDQSAVEAALRALLASIKRQHTPDYILLDARAGLHDLGGMSLHALAHVDVLIGRSASATLDGLHLVLSALSRRRKDEDLRVVMVQTFLPLPVGSDEHDRTRDNWAASLHDAFAQTIYQRMYTDRGNDLPPVLDAEGWHFPWAIPQYDSIARVDRLRDLDPTVVDSEPFLKLCNRIIERCGRSPRSVEETKE